MTKLKITTFMVLGTLCLSTSYAGTFDGAEKADNNNVAIGLASEALQTNSTTVGENSFAVGRSSSSYGAVSSATETNSTAIGAAALAEGEQSTALGAVSQALEINALAVGGNAYVEAVDGIALGESSSAFAEGGVAVGADSIADGNNSVALGSQSVARENNTVSVGDSETNLTRRVSNVADGIADNDVVNRGQFNRGLQGVRDDAFAGIAGVAALTPVLPSAAGKTALGLGAATYRGEQAVALSFSHRLLHSKNNTQINGGVSYDTSRHALGKVGVAWEF